MDTVSKLARLVLADDHSAILAQTVRLLEPEFEIVIVGTVGNGLDVIEAAMSLDPDVVVLDITMPGLDGIETARRLPQAGSVVVEHILEATSSGDVEVNDCAIHPLFSELPFGGVGNSGMGKYHGRWGFEAFTNARGVFHHSAKVDPGVRYPPYSKHTLERVVTNKLMP